MTRYSTAWLDFLEIRSRYRATLREVVKLIRLVRSDTLDLLFHTEWSGANLSLQVR